MTPMCKKHCILGTFPGLCDEEKRVYTLGGIGTQDLYLYRADILPRRCLVGFTFALDCQRSLVRVPPKYYACGYLSKDAEKRVHTVLNTK